MNKNYFKEFISKYRYRYYIDDRSEVSIDISILENAKKNAKNRDKNKNNAKFDSPGAFGKREYKCGEAGDRTRDLWNHSPALNPISHFADVDILNLLIL